MGFMGFLGEIMGLLGVFYGGSAKTTCLFGLTLIGLLRIICFFLFFPENPSFVFFDC